MLSVSQLIDCILPFSELGFLVVAINLLSFVGCSLVRIPTVENSILHLKEMNNRGCFVFVTLSGIPARWLSSPPCSSPFFI